MKNILFILPSVFFFLFTAIGFPCTAINLVDEEMSVVGANLDWPIEDGIIIINKRGFAKTALTDPKKKLNPVKWKSIYGSVTFSLFGCDWPWGGMNEAGLVGCTLQLPQTQYPLPDNRPSIFMGQWLQYQLDNHGTVNAVIESNDHLRIRQINKKNGVHYLFADGSGDCAVIEFLDNRCLVYHQATLPVRALTNDPYGVSLNVVERFKGYGDQQPFPYGNISLGRFLRASYLLENYTSIQEKSIIDQTFGILNKVAVNFHDNAVVTGRPQTKTQWRIVYDITNERIFFQTLKFKNIRHIDLKTINFDCGRPIMFLDINSRLVGDITQDFEVLTEQANRRLFEKAFKINPLSMIVNAKRIERQARYLNTFKCE